MTIASTTNKVWRKKFLIENLIALEPRNGWRQNPQNQSMGALQWLEFENSKMGGGIEVRFFRCSKSLHILKLSCRVLLHFSVGEMFIQCNGQCTVEIKNYNLRTAKETVTNVFIFYFSACAKLARW